MTGPTSLKVTNIESNLWETPRLARSISMGGSGTGGVFRAGDIEALREEARRRLEESQNNSAVNSLLQARVDLYQRSRCRSHK